MVSEKISVIIPTVQKNISVLSKLLDILTKDKAVSEILIINNLQQEIKGLKNNKKIEIINQNTNLYVNASWNLGVELAKNDIFLIINDDILPVENFCTMILQSGIFEKKTTGLVGINPAYINQYDKDTTQDISIPDLGNGTLAFTSLNRTTKTGDWGSAFFGRKRNYYAIPSDLKIIFGDNYLLNQNIQNAKVNYQISGLPFNHIHSLSSSSPEFCNIVVQDIQNSEKYIF